MSEKYTECPNKRVELISKETGESHFLNCKSYSCPYCGPIKRTYLRKGILKVLNQWDKVRFWTFTLSSKIGDKTIHLSILREAWRLMVDWLRKNHPNFLYIKIFEEHKSGYTHIHCFFNQYLRWSTIQGLWQHYLDTAIQKSPFVIDRLEKVGHCNVKGNFNARVGAAYVTKYVVKTAHNKSRIFRNIYSKSKIIIFFKKYNCKKIDYEVHIWVSHNRSIRIDKNRENLILSSLNLEINTQTIESEQLRIFETNTITEPDNFKFLTY